MAAILDFNKMALIEFAVYQFTCIHSLQPLEGVLAVEPQSSHNMIQTIMAYISVLNSGLVWIVSIVLFDT